MTIATDQEKPTAIPSRERMRNTYPQWFARTISTTGLNEQVEENFTLGRNREDYVLEYILLQFQEIGAIPTTFVNMRMDIVDESQGIVYMKNMEVRGLTTPGAFSTVVGGQRQRFQGALYLGFYMLAQSAFTIKLKNFGGAAKPTTIEIVLVGKRLRVI